MTCNDFAALLPRYPDDMPDEATKTAFEAHARECAACGTLLAEQVSMLDALYALDDTLELPAAFAKGWREAIQLEDEPTPAPRRTRRMGWIAAAAAVCLVIGGTAMMRGGFIFPQFTLDTSTPAQMVMLEESAAPIPAARQVEETPPERSNTKATAHSASAIDEETLTEMGDMPLAADYDAQEEPLPDEDAGAIFDKQERMDSASIALMSTAFDEDVAQIHLLLSENAGRIEYQYVQGGISGTQDASDETVASRSTYLRVRLPAANMDGLLEALEQIGEQTERAVYAKGGKVDAQAMSERLHTQRNALDLLNAQQEKTQDEQSLTEIGGCIDEAEYTIDSLTAMLEGADEDMSVAEDAEVTIRIEESEPPEVAIGQRISETLQKVWTSVRAFFSDMLVFLVFAGPYIAGVLILVFAGYIVAKAIKRKRKKE